MSNSPDFLYLFTLLFNAQLSTKLLVVNPKLLALFCIICFCFCVSLIVIRSVFLSCIVKKSSLFFKKNCSSFVRTNFYARYLSPSLWEGPRDFGLPKSLGGCYFCRMANITFQATRFTYYMYFFKVQNKSLLFFKFVNKKRYKKKSKKFLAPFKIFLPVYISFIFPRRLK